MTTVRSHDQEVWLSVQDASAMLGVSPATLRRWSTAGEVEAFTTPGGHRRFALTTLQALLPHPSDAPARMSALGQSGERMVKVLRRRSRSANDTTWLRDLDPEHREVLRAGGRAVTEALVAHLDAADKDASAAALARATAVAAEMGRTAVQRGATSSDLVAVFVHFKGLFVAELAASAVRHGLGCADAMKLVTRGGAASDRILEAMVAAFEEEAVG